MQDNRYAFPWGIYIGEFRDNGNRLPLFLPAETGGFTLFFDDESEQDANTFIEKCALRLFASLPAGMIKTTLFDFGYKKRFPDLSMLKDAGLYRIALSAEDADRRFHELEKTLRYRHHELLSPEITTISRYNRQYAAQNPQSYHLLLLNLHHYPKSALSAEKIWAFFESAFEAGFYTIAFADTSLQERSEGSSATLIDQFPSLKFEKGKLHFTETFSVLESMSHQYTFAYEERSDIEIVEDILQRFHSRKKSIPEGYSAIKEREEAI